MYGFQGLQRIAQAIARTDNRKAGRLACHALECQHGEVTDLSRTGARLITKRGSKLKVGEKLQLELGAWSGKLSVMAEAVWSKPGRFRLRGGGGGEVGLRFIDVDPAKAQAIGEMARLAMDDRDLSRPR